MSAVAFLDGDRMDAFDSRGVVMELGNRVLWSLEMLCFRPLRLHVLPSMKS